MTTPAEALARRAEQVRQLRERADELDELARGLREGDDADTAYAGELEAVAGDYRTAADLLEFGSPLLRGGPS